MDTCEEAFKSANIRAQKAEDEVCHIPYVEVISARSAILLKVDDDDDVSTYVGKLASPLISELKKLRMRWRFYNNYDHDKIMMMLIIIMMMMVLMTMLKRWQSLR